LQDFKKYGFILENLPFLINGLFGLTPSLVIKRLKQ